MLDTFLWKQPVGLKVLQKHTLCNNHLSNTSCFLFFENASGFLYLSNRQLVFDHIGQLKRDACILWRKKISPHHLPLPHKNTGTGDWDFHEFWAVRWLQLCKIGKTLLLESMNLVRS